MFITVMTPLKTCYPKGLFLTLANTDHHPSSNPLNWSVNRYTKYVYISPSVGVIFLSDLITLFRIICTG